MALFILASREAASLSFTGHRHKLQEGPVWSNVWGRHPSSKSRIAQTKRAFRISPSTDTTLPVRFERNITVIHDGRERTYGVLTPEGNPQKPPVVLMYHGSGSDAAAFASEGYMATEAPRQGYVMVYLEAMPASGYATRIWNSGSASGLADADLVDDVGYTAKVIADLIDKFGVDEKRIYVAGISSGGSMAIRTACERPELIAGVASVHGSLESRRGEKCATNCRPHGSCEWDATNPDCGADTWQDKLEPVFSCDGIKEHKVAVFLLNGNRDWFTAKMGEVWVSPSIVSSQHVVLAKGLANKLKPYSYPPRSFMYESFARSAGCSEQTQVSFKNGTGTDTTECNSYIGCGSNVTTCVAKAGHWWYGSPYDITVPCIHKGYQPERCTPDSQYWDYGRTTQSIETTSEILSFFSSNRKS